MDLGEDMAQAGTEAPLLGTAKLCSVVKYVSLNPGRVTGRNSTTQDLREHLEKSYPSSMVNVEWGTLG